MCISKKLNYSLFVPQKYVNLCYKWFGHCITMAEECSIKLGHL